MRFEYYAHIYYFLSRFHRLRLAKRETVQVALRLCSKKAYE